MRPRKIVLLGMMGKMPVPGVVWQTVHYLLGFRALGFEPYYVEAHARVPSMLMERATDDAGARAAAFIRDVMRRFDLGDAWAYHALHDAGEPCHGMTKAALDRLYRDAELLVNLHGGTEPRPEHYATGRLVYVQTDPVQLQIELHDGVQASYDFLDPHCAFFTFAENLGRPGCDLPLCDRFDFKPTRQPVVTSLWANVDTPERAAFTTIGNWRQPWRSVEHGGEKLSWSKDREWPAFLDLPRLTGREFELALSSYKPSDKEHLEKRGWRVRHALDFAADTGAYRAYIAGSRGEFTVAKEQNVRFRTGWFSDRSATYLASGRPVVTQDTAFGCALPTGTGLFGVRSLDDAAAAIEAIDGDYERHRRAAREIAAEHFEAERVLADMLGHMGIERGKEKPMTGTRKSAPAPKAERKRLTKDSRVLALIPHFQCEEWLDDALESLTEQTRPVDGIVVIDDASGDPPTRIVQRHPGVTLLHADRNVGPYRLVQQVIEETDYDAYMFQDADDWSAPDRLEKLLAAGERTGAELLGTQEMRVFCDEPEVAPIKWPLDVHAMFAEKPTAFPLLHPTSIVTRDLVMELGGFASGLRFSGDAEFLRRAQYVARVLNIPDYLYFRRIRQNSLTTARATGLKSPERQRVMEMLWERARLNAERAATGEQPDLGPIESAPPVGLRRLAGPPLSGQEAADAFAETPAAARPAAPGGSKGGPPRPIFVIGADRSGASALAWALGQHPRIPAVMDTGWVSELARELPAVHERTIGAEPKGHRAKSVSGERFSRTFGRAAAALVGDKLDRWVDCAPEHTTNVDALARLFPEAVFIHVVRDAGAAVRSLVDPPLGSAAATGGTQIPLHLRTKLSERDAVERWLTRVSAGVEAEKSLGRSRVLRVTYDDLIESPETLVRHCLEFAGEAYDGRCLRPLRGVRDGARGEETPAGASGERAAHPAIKAAAQAISAELVPEKRTVPQPVTAKEPSPRPRTPSVPPPQRDRIVMVTDHFPKFSETFFVSKFLGLRRRGWDVHVVANRSNADQWEFFPGLQEHRDLASRLHPTKEFEATIAELRPALMHFGYGTLALGRMHVAQMVGARTVVSFRGYDVNYFGLDDPATYDEVWEKADMLHFVGRDTWERAQRRGCPPDKPHALITDAVDVSHFKPPRRPADAAGSAERPLRIVSVGRLHWKKGHEFGLRAVRDLVDDGVEASYRIIGDGPHREATLFAIHDLGLEEHVSLVGAQPAEAVREQLAWADVFLHPAVSEGFCVSAIEAQAMGLPVVCSDADGLSENVIDGATGYVVPRRDSRGLAQRLGELARDGELRRRLGNAARRRATIAFDAEAQTDHFEALYRRLLAPAPAAEAAAAPAAPVSPPAGDDSPGAAARREALDALTGELGALEARAARLKKEVFGRQVVERVHELASAGLPAGAVVLVVSRGDEALVDLPGCRGWHFPQAPGGEYAGHHPADGVEAVEHLEDLRARGAEFLVIPATSRWWLEHYVELAEHLDDRYVRVADREDGYVAFSLTPRPAAAAPAAELDRGRA